MLLKYLNIEVTDNADATLPQLIFRWSWCKTWTVDYDAVLWTTDLHLIMMQCLKTEVAYDRFAKKEQHGITRIWCIDWTIEFPLMQQPINSWCWCNAWTTELDLIFMHKGVTTNAILEQRGYIQSKCNFLTKKLQLRLLLYLNIS